MLEAMLKLLLGLANTDYGVQSVLNQTAKDAVVDLIRNVYGDHAATTIDELFYIHASYGSDGNAYRCTDEVVDALRICLQGKG
jgi:hypothetical protein